MAESKSSIGVPATSQRSGGTCLLIHLTLTMSGLLILNAIPTIAIASLTEWYAATSNKSIFAVESINFMSTWVYVPVAMFVPSICKRVPRGQLFIVVTTLALFGGVLQTYFMQSYWCFLFASILQAVPQPFVLANLALLGEQYVSEPYRAQWLGIYTSVTTGLSGAAYMLIILYMSDVPSLIYWCNVVSGTGIGLIIVSCICFLFPYLVWQWDEDAARPLVVVKKVEGKSVLSVIGTQVLHASATLVVTLGATAGGATGGGNMHPHIQLQSHAVASSSPAAYGTDHPKKCRWQPGATHPYATQVVYVLWLMAYALLFGCSNTIDNVSQQLLVDNRVGVEQQFDTNLWAIILPAVAAFGMGLLYDKTPSMWLEWPLLLVIVQCIPQIALFTQPNTSDAYQTYLCAWTVLFYVVSAMLPIVFIPTLVEIMSRQWNEAESRVNGWLTGAAMTVSSVSTLVLLLPDASVSNFGPVVIATSLFGVTLMSVGRAVIAYSGTTVSADI